MNNKAQENKWFILKEDKEEKKLRINIYQIFTRLFGNKVRKNITYGTLEENGTGKFNDITETALQEIKKLGITHIWYTGVIEHALLTDYTKHNIPLDDADVVKGRAGSPYAIKDYFDVNPDLAVIVENRMQEFEDLVKRTHVQHLKVLIDFVPNHVARLYKSDVKPKDIEDFGEGDDSTLEFHPDNNFYYLVGHKFEVPENYEPLGKHPFINKDGYFEEYPAKATGNDRYTHKPEINDWFETVKLNYGINYKFNSKHFHPIPSTWKKMRDILIYWIQKDVDGFRCDMAEMVPVEFWNWVIPEVKKIKPDVIFIAEIYNPLQYHNYIFQAKSDFLYDKVQLYDTLRNIITGQDNTDQITQIWQFLRGINKNMLRFLENHDEQRIASNFFAQDPFKAIPAMAVAAFLY
ncbi:MAG: alpha-amylase family glycosyl hydrolase, partial [Bacteroidota bacterium]|nr:alpha-amylase family glycosyl hydrolase [Bacteroidota bacterium]